MTRLIVLFALLCVAPTLIYAQPLSTTPLEAFQRDRRPDPGVGPRNDGVSCGACHRQVKPPDNASPQGQKFINVPGGSGPVYQHQLWAKVPGEPPRFLSRVAFPRLDQFQDPSKKVPSPDEPHYLARRTAMQLFGDGYVEKVPPDTLAKYHDPFDANGDGISGRINGCSSWGPGRCIGIPKRFGWQACHSTLHDVIREALEIEFGVTPEEQEQYADFWDHEIDLLLEFIRSLPPRPPTRVPDETWLIRGEQLFQDIGCQDCHVPDYGTYSDYALHHMGPDSVDHVTRCGAAKGEWRTAELNAIRPAAHWHDGSVDTERLIDVIRRHGGEAAASRRKYFDLKDGEFRDLQWFVWSR